MNQHGDSHPPSRPGAIRLSEANVTYRVCGFSSPESWFCLRACKLQFPSLSPALLCYTERQLRVTGWAGQPRLTCVTQSPPGGRASLHSLASRVFPTGHLRAQWLCSSGLFSFHSRVCKLGWKRLREQSTGSMGDTCKVLIKASGHSLGKLCDLQKLFNLSVPPFSLFLEHWL